LRRRRRRAVGFYTRGRGGSRRVHPITARIRKPPRGWPLFTPEVWGWYRNGERWRPIYRKSTRRRNYRNTASESGAPDLHPVKLEQRQRLADWIKEKGTVLELYAGKGNLSKNVYARKAKRLVLVDKDAKALRQAHKKLKGVVKHDIIAMDNMAFIENMNLDDYRGLVLVDFDPFGSPAKTAKAFFDKYPVNKPLLVAFTDGSSQHNRFIQDEEGKRWLRRTYGVARIPSSTREGVISTLDRFMHLQGRRHSFSVERVSVGHGDANTVYVGYLIKPGSRAGASH